MKRLVLAAVIVAAAASAMPASAAATCPNGWYLRGTGRYNPVTGQEIKYCWPLT